VEIITAQGAQPNPGWLNYVVTAKARSTIRHFMKHQRRSEAMELGQRMLEKALAGLGSQLKDLPASQIEQLVLRTGLDKFDTILEGIGLGNRAAYLTARQLLNAPTTESEQAPLTQHAMIINGTEGFLVNFAKCCYPIPGDPIIGLLSSEKGVVVHTNNCHNSIEMRSRPEKVVPLSWADDPNNDFTVELKVELTKQRGIIAVLATRVNGADASIEKISVEDDTSKITCVHLLIGVRSRVHLANIMRRIRHIPATLRVTRVRH
jgi:guanosine-3',5'-bis(diphosphate) 3'-pyrophosphohydrolase